MDILWDYKPCRTLTGFSQFISAHPSVDHPRTAHPLVAPSNSFPLTTQNNSFFSILAPYLKQVKRGACALLPLCHRVPHLLYYRGALVHSLGHGMGLVLSLYNDWGGIHLSHMCSAVHPGCSASIASWQHPGHYRGEELGFEADPLISSRSPFYIYFERFLLDT